MLGLRVGLKVFRALATGCDGAARSGRVLGVVRKVVALGAAVMFREGVVGFGRPLLTVIGVAVVVGRTCCDSSTEASCPQGNRQRSPRPITLSAGAAPWEGGIWGRGLMDSRASETAGSWRTARSRDGRLWDNRGFQDNRAFGTARLRNSTAPGQALRTAQPLGQAQRTTHSEPAKPQPFSAILKLSRNRFPGSYRRFNSRNRSNIPGGHASPIRSGR